MVLLLSFVLAISSCEDDPSSLGIDIYEEDFPGDIIVVKEFDNYSTPINVEHSTFRGSDSLTFENSQRLLLGKLDNIRYNLLVGLYIEIPDSFGTSLNNDQLVIESAKLELIPNYRVGNTSESYSFEVYQVNKQWGRTNFNKDSLNELRTSIGNYNLISNKEDQDTLITMDFSEELALNWLKSAAGDTEADNNYGILFQPTYETDGVMGIAAVAGQGQSYAIRLLVSVLTEGKYQDTLLFPMYWDVSVADEDEGQLNFETDELIVQGGVPLRSSIKFDLSDLPKNIAINKAILEMTIDTSKSILSSPRSEIEITPYYDSTKTTLVSLKSYMIQSADRGDLYTAEISNLLQYIISQEANYGFNFQYVDEYSTASRIIMKNSITTISEEKPHLIIYYTRKSTE